MTESKFKLYLRRKDLTINKVAELMGMTNISLHNKITGRTQFLAREAIHFAAITGVQIDFSKNKPILKIPNDVVGKTKQGK